jgi:hypothetical protein
MKARYFYWFSGLGAGLLPYDILKHSYGWIVYDIIVFIVGILAGSRRIKEGKP